MTKRLLVLTLAFILIIGLVGCNTALKDQTYFGDRDTIGELDKEPIDTEDKNEDKTINLDNIAYDTESYIDNQEIKFRDNIDIDYIKSIFSNNPVYKDLHIGDYEKIEYTNRYYTDAGLMSDYKNIDTVGLVIPFIYGESKDISKNITITISRFRSTDIVCEVKARFIGSIHNIEETYGIKEEDILKSMEEVLAYIVGTDVASRIEKEDFETTLYLDDKAEFNVVSVHNSPYGDTIDFKITGSYNESVKDDIEISTLPSLKIDYDKYFGEYRDTIEEYIPNLPIEGDDIINMSGDQTLLSLSARSDRNKLIQMVDIYNFSNYEIDIPELGINESKFSSKCSINYHEGNPKTYEVGEYLNTKVIYNADIENNNGNIQVFLGIRCDADKIWDVDRELLIQLAQSACNSLTSLNDYTQYMKESDDTGEKVSDTSTYTETIGDTEFSCKVISELYSEGNTSFQAISQAKVTKEG